MLHVHVESDPELLAILTRIAKEIQSLRATVYRPGPMRLRLVSEGEGVNDMLRFVIVLPSPSAPDVVSAELSVRIGDAEPIILNPALTDTESELLDGEQDQPIHAELVHVDDNDNRSSPRTLDAILKDTIAPPQPGEMGIVVKEEV